MRFKTSTLAIVLTFVVSTGMLVALVGLTFSQIRIEDDKTYKADFTDASGLVANVDVRGSGVAIGSVKSVKRRDAGGVVVTFTVPKSMTLTSATEARIRYANLTGDRYLEVTPGEAESSAAALPADATIPESRTRPALELDDLFAGFDPLMQALSPDEVNELTSNILGVTNGQSGAVESMLANVGSFTSGLAERDELIGSVIDELSQTLATVDDRRAEFDNIITGLASLTGKLDRDRDELTDGLAQFSTVGSDLADFLEVVRPGLKANIDQLGTTAAALNADDEYVNRVLGRLSDAVSRVGRLGGNASQFNFFVCGIKVALDIPGQDKLQLPGVYATNERCKNDPGDK